MKCIKLLLVIAWMASAQISYTQNEQRNSELILAAKEIELIRTNRIIASVKDILTAIETAKDWSIFHEATVPSRTETMENLLPSLRQTLANILEDYATCVEKTVPAFWGLSEKTEFYIIDKKESDLKIISNKEFKDLLKKAIGLFEKEYESGNNTYYDSSVAIPVNPVELPTRKLTLHEIYEAIEKAEERKFVL